jgi:hypothetical protein
VGKEMASFFPTSVQLPPHLKLNIPLLHYLKDSEASNRLPRISLFLHNNDFSHTANITVTFLHNIPVEMLTH